MHQLQLTVLSKPFNLILFNLLWAGLVIGRDSLLNYTIPILVIYITLLIFAGSKKIYQFLIPASLGITVDCTFAFSGVFTFSETFILIPIWLIALWFAFSSTLTLSLSYIGRNKIIAIAAGAFLMPLNYAIGARLGAVEFAEPYIVSLLSIGVVWMIGLPVLFFVSRQNFEEIFHKI